MSINTDHRVNYKKKMTVIMSLNINPSKNYKKKKNRYPILIYEIGSH
jgi:hypothetical protein